MPRKPWKPGRRDRRVLLALLTGATNLSGYPLSKVAQVGAGGVYVSLAHFEREGWVLREPGPVTPNGRRRYSYRLTPRGRSCAMKALGLESTVEGASDG